MNRFFHKGYFNEMFRQLKAAGLVCAGVLMLGNFGTLLMMLSAISGMPPIPDAASLAGSYRLYIYVTGFLFTFLAFGWLNKRSQSDFYHSVPVTRTQQYISTVAAVLAWMFIGVTAFAAVKALIYLLFGLPFNYLLNLCVVINMLIGCIEVVGAVALACAISGTRFVNFFAALVILFAPRALMYVLALFIDTLQTKNIIVSSLSIFFDPTFNIIATPTAALPSLIAGSNIDFAIDYANVPAMLYTLAYSLILHLLGCIAFNKRRSEAAGIPTTNRAFQRIIGIFIALPLLLILDMLLLQEPTEFLLIPMGLLVIFSFVLFCLYNLISTKSGKKTVAEMPWFFVSIAAALIMLFLPKIIVKAAESVKLAPEDIKGYYLPRMNEDEYERIDFDIFYLNEDVVDHVNTVGRKCMFSDEESAKIIAEAFDNTDRRNEMYDRAMVVRIVRKHGADLVRKLYFSSEELIRLEDYRTQNERYAGALTEFPSGRNYYAAGMLNRRDSAKLAEVFKEEFDALTPEKRELLNTSYDPNAGYFGHGSDLTVYGCMGVDNYCKVYRLDRMMPNTYKAYLQLINERYGDNAKTALEAIGNWTRTGDTNGENEKYFSITLEGALDFNIVEYSLAYNGYVGNSELPKDTDPEFCELLDILIRGELTDDIDSAIIVNVDYTDYMSIRSSRSGLAAIKLSAADLARAKELLNTMRIKYEDDYR